MSDCILICDLHISYFGSITDVIRWFKLIKFNKFLNTGNILYIMQNLIRLAKPLYHPFTPLNKFIGFVEHNKEEFH